MTNLGLEMPAVQTCRGRDSDVTNLGLEMAAEQTCRGQDFAGERELRWI
jgi:hypothetical protein